MDNELQEQVLRIAASVAKGHKNGGDLDDLVSAIKVIPALGVWAGEVGVGFNFFISSDYWTTVKYFARGPKVPRHRRRVVRILRRKLSALALFGHPDAVRLDDSFCPFPTCKCSFIEDKQKGKMIGRAFPIRRRSLQT